MIITKTAIKRAFATVTALALILMSWMITAASDGMEPDEDEAEVGANVLTGAEALSSEADAVQTTALSLNAKSVILMEASTGRVLYESNADERLRPASVTKIMTILLVMEAIKAGTISYDDIVSVSENAASMGGSQVYLEPGEQMSVEELLKCVIISSANDASVALAEHVAGSEEAFIQRMNERAEQLGMKNTHFVNTSGLDDAPESDKHLTSARDVAIMSRELINNHPDVFKYSTIWMDTIRNGAFGLTNTNRLIRFYRGATGLKTGSTSKAGFCISATAERDGMSLIAVVMASPTRDIRNEAAKTLLDYGFANFCVYSTEGGSAGLIPVTGGVAPTAEAHYDKFSVVLPKGKDKNVVEEIKLNESVAAPVNEGDEVGVVTYTLDGEVIGTVPITAANSVAKIGYGGLLLRLIRSFLLN